METFTDFLFDNKSKNYLISNGVNIILTFHIPWKTHYTYYNSQLHSSFKPGTEKCWSRVARNTAILWNSADESLMCVRWPKQQHGLNLSNVNRLIFVGETK